LVNKLQRLADELSERGVITPDMPDDVAARIVVAEARRRSEAEPPPNWN